MKTRKLLFLMVTIFVLLLAACSEKPDTQKDVDIDKEATENLNKDGMPIVKEPITLHFMAGKSPVNSDNYNEVLVWKEYAKLSNINIEWELIQTDGLEEKRNLALASGNLPDVFYTSSMPTTDLLKYGEQGVFVALNDLIEQYMPNLTALFEKYPEIKKGITFPDGNIYSLPTIHDPDFLEVNLGMSHWINEDWLNKLGMELPQTTEEYYQYLKAVKETDLNGNGVQDEIPYGAHNAAGIKDVLKGAFGVGNKGHGNQYVDEDPETGEVRFFPITEGYKEMLQYINKLFSEGLIQENIYTIETNQSFAMGSEGLYGSTVISTPESIYGEEGKKFSGLPALEGPHGDRQVTRIGSSLAGMSGFVVTSENKNIPATLRWMDYFYSEEGATLFFMGVEGQTYEKNADGELQYVESITKSSEGLTFEQELAKYITWLGGGYPGYVKEDWFKGGSSSNKAKEAADRVRPYVKEIWPKFLFTPEESKKMTALAADIEKYVQEMTDKFITGNVPFSEWEKYVKTINDMGLEEYMEIQSAAYERYKNS